MTPLYTSNQHTKPAMEQIAFRTMNESDINVYCTVFLNVFSSPPWNEEWTIDKIGADINKLIRKNGCIGMVAQAGTKSVGYAAGAPLCVFSSIFYLAQLFIENDYQGKGIGKNIMGETIRLSKQHGVSKIVLLTKPHSKAEEFYLHNGFRLFFPLFRINGKRILYKKI